MLLLEYWQVQTKEWLAVNLVSGPSVGTDLTLTTVRTDFQHQWHFLRLIVSLLGRFGKYSYSPNTARQMKISLPLFCWFTQGKGQPKGDYETFMKIGKSPPFLLVCPNTFTNRAEILKCLLRGAAEPIRPAWPSEGARSAKRVKNPFSHLIRLLPCKSLPFLTTSLY